jgi:hypothetical protein
MKKALFLLLVLFVSVVSVWAQAGTRHIGGSPQTNTMTVTVTIPTRVGIYLERNVAIDVGAAPNAVHYPPSGGPFPGYYRDNTNFSPTMGLEVFCNNATGWTLTVQAGSGSFYAGGPTVQQLYFAPTGTAMTADGVAGPVAPWTAFDDASPVSVGGAVAKTTGWEAHNQNLELQLTGTEDAGGPGAVTMTYTITNP